MARVRAALPSDAEVVPAAARTAFVGQLTRAFDVNLTALSLLALIVGLFLAYNTMTFSVVQRRRTIGMMRALGVTRTEIVAAVLAEALLLGLVATTLGLALGVALGRGLVQLVTQTINDLYFVVVVRDLAIAPASLAKAAATRHRGDAAGGDRPRARGDGDAAGGRDPARRAGGAGPACGRARGGRGRGRPRWVGRCSWAGRGGASPGATPGSSRSFSGPRFSRRPPWSAPPPLRGRGSAGSSGLPGRMAARNVVATLSRTGVAVAALMVAVAATIGVGVMVRSFRATVVTWLETSLAADVYVAAPALSGSRRGESTLDPTVVARVRETPGAAAVGTYRGVRVTSPFGPTQLVALGIDPGSYRQFRFLAGEPESVWPAFQDGGAAIVSEPYAYRHGLGVGSVLPLRTDRGERTFPVVGVFADYGSDQGVVMLSRRTYEAHWDDRGVSSMGLVLEAGRDVGAVIADLRARVDGRQELLIRSSGAIRAASLEIFDRTFQITNVLRVLATVVAGIGIMSALMALQLERARELGVLRAQGLMPREVWQLVVTETGFLGAIAGILAVPVGIGLALVLIHVINRRAFGWSIDTTVPAEILLQAVGLAVLAALLAGAYPAWRLARTPPAPALREE